jgi:DNA-directed RNA polymerase subunit RPC12/RpoP
MNAIKLVLVLGALVLAQGCALECSECERNFPKTTYTNNQIRKKAKRRCPTCTGCINVSRRRGDTRNGKFCTENPFNNLENTQADWKRVRAEEQNNFKLLEKLRELKHYGDRVRVQARPKSSMLKPLFRIWGAAVALFWKPVDTAECPGGSVRFDDMSMNEIIGCWHEIADIIGLDSEHEPADGVTLVNVNEATAYPTAVPTLPPTKEFNMPEFEYKLGRALAAYADTSNKKADACNELLKSSRLVELVELLNNQEVANQD